MALCNHFANFIFSDEKSYDLPLNAIFMRSSSVSLQSETITGSLLIPVVILLAGNVVAVKYVLKKEEA